ncbi:MAG: DUF523 domain-containing protein, partial [Acidiferrobacterales bacterium]
MPHIVSPVGKRARAHLMPTRFATLTPSKASSPRRRTGQCAPAIRVGVSACLLGEAVRYDGSDKHDAIVMNIFGRFFELVPVCPEVAIGMGVPRSPIRLVNDSRQVRAIGVEQRDLDVTTALRSYGQRMVRELADVSGYIFKSRSPSCGVHDVPVYKKGSRPIRSGTGLFAREWTARRPLLPVEDETQLGDPDVRDNFLERIFFYRRWQELTARDLTRRKLLVFHTAHKLMLMAHGDDDGNALRALADQTLPRPSAALATCYLEAYMRVLRRHATRRRHRRVLRYLARRLERQL